MAQITKKDFDRLYGAACTNGLAEPERESRGKRWTRVVLIGIGIVGLVAALVLAVGMAGLRSGEDFVVWASDSDGPAPATEDSNDFGLTSPVISEVPVDEPVPEESPRLWVHVDGAVAAPGVYGLPEGARMYEALEMAGGVVPGANMAPINLAAPVSDGSKVRVPFEGEEIAVQIDGAQEALPVSDFGLVNINTAGAAELERLPGIGPALAAAIVDERERGGPYAAPEDLLRVSGIGDKKLAKLVGSVTT